MNTELDQRESKVLDFINAKNKELSAVNSQNALDNDPALKMKKLNDECKKGTSICIDTILGRLYKDALPFDDPKKNCSDDEMRDEIHDYIARRTGGKNSEYYVREGIKRTNSKTLKELLNVSESISSNFYREKVKDLGSIRVKDLNFNPNISTDDMNKITRKLELDEISDIIMNNVQTALKNETDKANRETEYYNNIENQLADNPEVQDDSSMESALEKMRVIGRPTVYQPSLMEAILLGKTKTMKESAGNDIIYEAIEEYTKLSMSKALKLEKFDLASVKKLANSYL